VASDDRNEVVQAFDEVLSRSGVHGALEFLNARIPHRFTGVYRHDPPRMRNIHLFDRENPRLEVGGDVPMRESYCSIVVGRDRPFRTGNAREDEELRDHPSRESTLSYCGVPLRDPDGRALGTLCHFDLESQEVFEAETGMLEAVMPRLVERLRAEGAL